MNEVMMSNKIKYGPTFLTPCQISYTRKCTMSPSAFTTCGNTQVNVRFASFSWIPGLWEASLLSAVFLCSCYMAHAWWINCFNHRVFGESIYKNPSSLVLSGGFPWSLRYQKMTSLQGESGGTWWVQYGDTKTYISGLQEALEWSKTSMAQLKFTIL